ncbi:hypothetical protein [Leptospira noguchii]|uniref:Uncharacterized protein n=1 Tax=Leptospira noguchii TaxID=28182 RepID=A0AAE9KAS0_9LEPT|nr:hypothetical protein [Leptospira noguchii]UOG58439.1 hypothetical protein MAL03_08270 [Leptospira noguchii]
MILKSYSTCGVGYGSRAILSIKFVSCDDDPVAPEFIIRPNLLTPNSR